MIRLVDDRELLVESTVKTKIKVVGVGGAGGNTVNSMVRSGFDYVEFIAANTDSQALENSSAHRVIRLGNKLTRGLGSGTNPEIGRRATEEDLEAIYDAVADADIVFLTAGLGGGTGSGGIPVIARALREKGILTIAVVTKPFAFEGRRRSIVADEALALLHDVVDTLIVLPNQKLIDISDESLSLLDAFEQVNGFVSRFVRGIADIIMRPGHINVDFADIQTIMRNAGNAVMGVGQAQGPDRAREATLQAISCNLLEGAGVGGARGVLVNIAGSARLGLHEVGAVMNIIYEQVDEEANIVLGSVIDDALQDDVCVTLIATGFTGSAVPARSSISGKTFVASTKSAGGARIIDAENVTKQNISVTTRTQPIEMSASDIDAIALLDPLDMPAILRQKNSIVTQDHE